MVQAAGMWDVPLSRGQKGRVEVTPAEMAAVLEGIDLAQARRLPRFVPPDLRSTAEAARTLPWMGHERRIHKGATVRDRTGAKLGSDCFEIASRVSVRRSG